MGMAQSRVLFMAPKVCSISAFSDVGTQLWGSGFCAPSKGRKMDFEAETQPESGVEMEADIS
jgi:hypothetical protein